ncbi:Adenosine deaminase 2 [Frankliniella fusca]|uniref:Adenosine deaminase n=1 Tax=Frankliniella fusca TaxID=407009 RepID=A0AAE1LJF6_9NEOP|nr:Adenosine deaminase 2 [Frankliniella fusca]
MSVSLNQSLLNFAQFAGVGGEHGGHPGADRSSGEHPDQPVDADDQDGGGDDQGGHGHHHRAHVATLVRSVLALPPVGWRNESLLLRLLHWKPKAMAVVGVLAVLVLAGASATVGVLASPASTRDAPGRQAASIGYLVERTKFLNDESHRFLGNLLPLNAAEQRVSRRLMAWKEREYNVPEADFLPAHSFFLVREKIERSAVYRFIRRMPKGAVLHVHDLSAANADYVVQNVTYREHVWGLLGDGKGNGAVQLRFAPAAPGPGWELVADLRRRAASVQDFDAMLSKVCTITDMNPDETYPDQATVWHAFDGAFSVLFSLLTYAPVFRDYFRRTLEEFYEDNVMYVEIRGVLPPLFDLDGKEYGQMEVAAMYKQVADEFRREHPDFLGVRLIYAPSRHVSVGEVHEYLEFFRKLKTQYPDFVAGFDLVAHEDDGRPLIDFVPSLLQLRRDLPDVKYFFHAGETNWEQSLTDENLVDAVLLNTTRIGHGYAIDKHPKVMEIVKERGIGIELNPISNQVLKLVQDLRNHPGAALLADNYPVVISSDDPGMWGARGLSYDFYEAFMGMTGLKADLRTLKQLTINSIRYSAMGEAERSHALSVLERRWQDFIEDVDNERFPEQDLPVVRQLRGLAGDSAEHDNSIHSVTSWEA